MAWWKTAAHCLVTFVTFQLVIVTLAEAGLVYPSASRGFDPDAVYTAFQQKVK